MRLLTILIVLFVSCFNSKKNKLIDNSNVNQKIVKEDSVILRVNELSKIALTQLPIGNSNIIKDITKKSLYNTNKNGDIELNDDFLYSFKGEILNDFFHNFYEPTLSSSRESDKYPLYTDKEYLKEVGITSSGLEKIIQKKEGVFWCIFYVNFKYEREYETFVKPIRYLVALDNNLKILNEITLSLFYETETKSFMKLFYLDEKYNLYTRYYRNKEYEDGEIKESFSELHVHKIKVNGEISG